MQPFSLQVVPSFENIITACGVLGLTSSIDVDMMYDEFSSAKSGLENVIADDKSDSATVKWQTFFASCGEKHVPVNLLKNCFLCVVYPGK